MTSFLAQIPQATENTFLASTRNPNDNKNRVPTLTELKGLRGLMESNLNVEKVLQDEVARLQSSQKALSEQLIRQQLDLEATQSELFETNNLIESLGIQCSALQGRTQNLRALIHPIRRLPAEIWRHVFESTVEISDEKVREATKLSSICRLWRAIALDTPRLWSTITTSAPSVSKEPWDHWVVLMRSTPANICISNISNDDDEFQDGPLSKIPNLRTLALELVDATELDNLFTELFDAQYEPLNELSISLEEVGLPVELPLDSLTGHFPSLANLTLTGPLTIRSQESSPSSLVTVSLSSLEVDFYNILRLFPLLETLELNTVTLTITGEPQKVTSNSIRRLKFYTPIFDFVWVMELCFPRLRSLFYGHDSTPLFINFIKSHPSIMELDCCNQEEDQLIEEISTSSEVTHLSITSAFIAFADWRTFGLLGVPFPSLQVLMFGDQDVPPDVVEFEGVIRARCLPMNHPMSLLERENLLLKELRILVGTRAWEGEAWSLHALAQEASREIVPYNEIDGWDCVVLRWNLEQ